MTPAWLAEVTAAAGPPFLRMGTHALAGGWRLDGDDVPELLAEKRRVLARHHDEAVAVLPVSDAAAAELLAELLAELAGPADTGGGDRPRGPLHPLDQAGRLVAEDLCLLTREPGGWILVAGSVCFPSHWRLVDKLGHPIAEVHAPVPHYPTELAERVDRFLDRLPPGPGVWRRNWTVHTSPQLFAPIAAPPPRPPITEAGAGQRLWFRSEYQTLRRLRESGAIVFSIRTQQVPLAVLAGRPGLCRDLAAAAAAWPPELLAYRGGEAVRRPFLAWLRSAAGPVPASGGDRGPEP